jgi:uncharacterized protein YecT (DUF1311 family)
MALGDDEYRLMRSQSRDFAAADKRLNAAWGRLMSVAPHGRRGALLQSQQAWMRQGRDTDAQGILKSRGGLSRATEDDRADRTRAYATATADRAKLLEICARQFADPNYVPSFLGVAVAGRDARGGFLGLRPDGFAKVLRVRPNPGRGALTPETAEILERFANAPARHGETARIEVRGRLEGVDGDIAADRRLRIIAPNALPY